MNSLIILESIWPTTGEGWVNLIVFIVGFIAAVAVLIPVAIKLVKKGAELVKNKNWSKIQEIAMAAMKEAEASGKKGAEKQQMVIDAVVAGCKEAGVEVSEDDLKNLASYINTTIDWFNKMNDSSAKEEKADADEQKSVRKFLVTEEEEKEINKGK